MHQRGTGASVEGALASNPHSLDLANKFVWELAYRHPRVKAHCERVAKMAAQMAHILGLDLLTIREVELAGALHDIGKIYVSRSIIDKPNCLTQIEILNIQEVPLYSASIAQHLGLSGRIFRAISQRHERPDGRGYPYGLPAEMISPLSKIIAVADAYDSMVHDQPYRKSCAPIEAIGTLRCRSQTQYDPQVVDCLTIIALQN